MRLAHGTLLKNRYEIVGLVGSGGYSFVYKAIDVFNEKALSIKQSSNTDAELEKQHRIEIDILQKISQKHISSFPVFVDAFSENGYSYIVLEYIDGQSLREIVDIKGNLALSVSLNIILQVGGALRHIHQLEPFPVIHRDVNPSNILLRKDGTTAVLIDFGLVKVDNKQETVAAAKAVTPGFSAVEQYGSALTDMRSDVYSLGATLFYLLSGETPQESVQRIETDYLSQKIDNLHDVPKAVIDAIRKATSLTLQERYQSIDEFLLDINKCWKEITTKFQFQSNHPEEHINSEKPRILSSDLSDSPTPLEFSSPASIETIRDGHAFSNCITWKLLDDSEIVYLVVKKHGSKPRNQNDGDTFILQGSSFTDKDVENGILVYYSLYAIKGSLIARCTTQLPPIIRMDDVRDLTAKRTGKIAVVMNFELPKNVKQVIIRKSISKKPSSLYDGYLVHQISQLEDAERLVEVIDTGAERLPTYYSVFCRYQIKRSTLLTSSGISILVQ